MRKKPTQTDVAKLAGVSRTTVSYVINNREAEYAIPSQTTKRVWSAVQELGYVPNQVAQHLKRQATNRICVILPRLGIPMHDLMLRAYRDYTTRQSYSVIITVGDSNEHIAHLLSQVQGGLADAVHLDLSYGAISNIDEILTQVDGIGVPVIVAANIEATSAYDTYWETDKEAAYKAIQYLVKQGHRDIAFLGHNIAEPDRYGRYQSYTEALLDNDILISPQYIRTGIESRQQAHELATDLLNQDKPPSAIFCTADINALTTIAAAQKIGYSVPDDLAVVGCGNISEGQYSHPSLTTIGPVTRSFDEIAILMMHRLTDQEQRPRQKVIQKWKLIVRESA